MIKEMKSNINRLLIGAAMLVVLIVPAGSVYAAAGDPVAPAAKTTPTKCGESIFFPTWYANGLCNEDTGIVSPGSFDNKDSGKSFGKWASILALNLVTILLYVVGYTTLGFIIYGGFKYMTSGDSSGGTASAKTTILNAVIGLVLSIMSVALVRFIAGAIA
jgi:hypothetical protein